MPCTSQSFTNPTTLSTPWLPADSYEATCAFTDFGNWLVPGRLMLGRYPFVEPSRCRSRDLGEDQLRQLLRAGITAFVCLQVGGRGWPVVYVDELGWAGAWRE